MPRCLWFGLIILAFSSSCRTSTDSGTAASELAQMPPAGVEGSYPMSCVALQVGANFSGKSCESSPISSDRYQCSRCDERMRSDRTACTKAHNRVIDSYSECVRAKEQRCQQAGGQIEWSKTEGIYDHRAFGWRELRSPGDGAPSGSKSACTEVCTSTKGIHGRCLVGAKSRSHGSMAHPN